MSHYPVAVFHRKNQSIEELLAPYDECLKVEPYIEYTRQEAIDYVRKNFDSFADKTDEECWQLMADDAGEDMVDEDGNIYSDYNPNSKWDWYLEGGRWSGMLKCRNRELDSCRVGDIDFSDDQEVYEKTLRFWDVVVDHKPAAPNEEYHTIYKEEYLRDRYKDRETYAKYMASFNTYAVLTPDGEWHAPGDMGWFGCPSGSNEEARDWYEHYKERFIDTADPDWILTIVDCHI